MSGIIGQSALCTAEPRQNRVEFPSGPHCPSAAEEDSLHESVFEGDSYQSGGSHLHPDQPEAFTQISRESAPLSLKKWNIFVYLAADNDLEYPASQMMLRLERVGSDENMNILTQFDRGMEPRSRVDGGWEGARRYHISKGTLENNYLSPVVSDLGQVDMADPAVLADFIVWGMKNYPAEKNMILLYDHGQGFLGSLIDVSGKSMMSLPLIHQAFQEAQKRTGQKFDIIAFDACVMADVEVAYQLRDDARLLLASQETTSYYEGNYQGVLDRYVLKTVQKEIEKKGDISAFDLARSIVESTRKSQLFIKTYSCIDLSMISALKDSIDGLALSLIATKIPGEIIIDCIKKTEHYAKSRPWMKPFSDLRDICDFSRNLVDDARVTDPEIRRNALRVDELIAEAIPAEQHRESYEGTHGISIYMPDGPPGHLSQYEQGQFAVNTHWDEFLRKL